MTPLSLAGGKHFKIGQALYRPDGYKIGHVRKVMFDYESMKGLEACLITDENNVDHIFTNLMLDNKVIFTRKSLKADNKSRKSMVSLPPEVICIGSRMFNPKTLVSEGTVVSTESWSVGLNPQPSLCCRTSVGFLVSPGLLEGGFYCVGQRIHRGPRV